MGNRDVNKMRFTAELQDEEIARLSPATPAPFWVRENDRVTPWRYLQELAAQDHDIPVADVQRETVLEYNTKANRMRYHLKCDMGSDGEFEFRRQELGILAGFTWDSPEEIKEIIDDDQVVKSYEETFRPDGLFGEFLKLGQLACFLNGTLIVHGQLIGNDFQCSKDGIAESVRVVPGPTVGEPSHKEEDLCDWVVRLNEWYISQIEEWVSCPHWKTPPVASSLESWRHRGASGLIAYGTPSTPWPSVVYCRWLEKNSMPRQYPKRLTEYLLDSKVRRVIVGHTPHGNCPTVIWNDSLPVVMADTSYSAIKSNRFYQGDNRGDAFALVNIEGGSCLVKGKTGGDESKHYKYEVTACSDVGKMVSAEALRKTANANKPYFIKARLSNHEYEDLPSPQYLACNIEGFIYTYFTTNAADLRPQSGRPQCMVAGDFFQELGSSGKFFGASERPSDTEVVDAIFSMMDSDDDGMVTRGELTKALQILGYSQALNCCIPTSVKGETNFEDIFSWLDQDHSGNITREEFLDVFRSATPTQGNASRRPTGELIRCTSDSTRSVHSRLATIADT